MVRERYERGKMTYKELLLQLKKLESELVNLDTEVILYNRDAQYFETDLNMALEIYPEPFYKGKLVMMVNLGNDYNPLCGP